VHTFIKYLLFQIPQWLALALFLGFLVDRTAVPPWAGIGFFIFWVIKDLAMYPVVRRAYANDAKTGAEALVGSGGVACERIDPQGYVKIRGELWKARTNGRPISKDTVVKVTGASAMTLIVEPADGGREPTNQNSAA
jgi:membrane protein implicated in regulation of membrane protease activity